MKRDKKEEADEQAAKYRRIDVYLAKHNDYTQRFVGHANAETDIKVFSKDSEFFVGKKY